MTSPVLSFVLALITIIALARVAGRAVALLGQPRVIGEMVAGIALGPSLLGRVAPSVEAYLFPHEVVPYLKYVAGVGVALFMFTVGLELDAARLRERARSAAVISVAGIVVPLVLSWPVAGFLYPTSAPLGVSFPVFGAFFAVAMSVTAFPVLARILAERGLERTRLGMLALTCAAVDDVSAWCLLAVVVGYAASSSGNGLGTIAGMLAYLVLMLTVAKRGLKKLAASGEKSDTASCGAQLFVLAVLASSAAVTDWIGIHSLFGAFLTGALLPADSGVSRALVHRIERPVQAFLLPVFFAFAGLRTEFGLLREPKDWLFCALVLAVAFLGKLGGTFVAARFTGAGTREAAMLGILMNTRGLMELVVLNVGMDLKIISPSLFATMVIMALATTLAAGPLLRIVEHSAVTTQRGKGAT